MAIIFQDLFEEQADTLLENHTPDVGTGWTILYDSLTTSVVLVKPVGQSASNVVGPDTSDSGAGRAFAIQPAPGAADVALEVDVYETDWSRTNTYNRGLFARDTGGHTHYAVSILPNGNAVDSVRLFKTVSGVSTLLGSYDATLANGDAIRFECTDSEKAVYVNGTKRISSLDNDITGAGGAGLWWGNWDGQNGGGHPDRRGEFGHITVESDAGGSVYVDLAASIAGGAGLTASLSVISPPPPPLPPPPVMGTWDWGEPASQRLYQLAFYDHHRELVDVLDASALSEVKYSRQLNNYGALQFTLRRDRAKSFHTIRDVLVELQVSVDGGPMTSEGAYLIRQAILLPGEPDDVWVIGAVGLEHLLARRIFLADDDPLVANGYSTKYDRASEVIASVVEDQCINPALRPERAIAGLSITPHSPSGDPLPFREQSSETKVLEHLKKLATAGHTDFWIEYDPVTETTPVHIGARGTDRRKSTNWPISPVVYFSPDNGAMAEPELDQDYREEQNAVFVFGQGPAGGRFIYSKSSTATTVSPWNRCEFGVTANQYTTIDDLFGEADAALINALASQTRFTFTVPQDGPLQYLRDWFLGDLVNAGVAGVEFDMRVAGVTVTLNAEGMTVDPELVRYQI